jgi:FtsP/CotA-like multicopper oxidase with cupredoxin domain
MLAIVREKHHGHASPTDFAIDCVPVGQRRLHLIEEIHSPKTCGPPQVGARLGLSPWPRTAVGGDVVPQSRHASRRGTIRCVGTGLATEAPDREAAINDLAQGCPHHIFASPFQGDPVRSMFVLCVAALVSGAPYTPPTETALPNDNRVSAGRLANGVLTIALEARPAAWHPESDDGPFVPVYAFAERGQRARLPGPLIRVPVGTTVAATVRNTLTVPMKLFGLRGRADGRRDSTIVEPGATHELRFAADVPGTHFYYARTEDFPPQPGPGNGADAGLVGGFVVDSTDTPPKNERILFIHGFFDTVSAFGSRSDAAHRVLGREFIRRDTWAVVAVNGKSWPHTERFSYAEGDTVRYRVISTGPFPHPMHLHGFHFQVHARGDVRRDTIYPAALRRDVVTEVMLRGSTMSMSWVAARPGNWLFHCHFVPHIADVLRLPSDRPTSHANHAEGGMAGLVTGIHVKPARNVTLAAAAPPRSRLRLFVTERSKGHGDNPAFSYVLQQGATAPASDSINVPSSTLYLRQHEPTEIAVINAARQPTTVHWHGIEVESFFDGVGDWSGWGSRVASPIAPGDSFVVRLTPPRAGTFMYHTHLDEGTQLASGLFGALIVVPPGTSPDTTDRLVMIAMAGPNEDHGPSVNGSATGQPIELRAGTPHRLRVINISPLETRGVELLAGSAPTSWRPVAKDGAALPAVLAVSQNARKMIYVGETYDFEVLRQRPETLTLRISGAASVATRTALRATAERGERLPRLSLDVPVIVR